MKLEIKKMYEEFKQFFIEIPLRFLLATWILAGCGIIGTVIGVPAACISSAIFGSGCVSVLPLILQISLGIVLVGVFMSLAIFGLFIFLSILVIMLEWNSFVTYYRAE